MQSWNEDEIKELLLFVQSLRNENDDLRAKVIAMYAMLSNEVGKNKMIKQTLQNYTA